MVSCKSTYPPPSFNPDLPRKELVPKADFPHQLAQASLAVSHLCKDRPASHIHLAGDSAGGNLVIQILSHLIHPLPSIKPLLSLQGKLGSAVMISPWARLTGDGPTVYQNRYSDLTASSTNSRFGALVLAGIPDLESNRPYIEPAKAPVDWFSGVAEVVEEVVVTNAEREALCGDIAAFVDIFRPYFPKLHYLLERNAKHVEPLLGFQGNAKPFGPIPESAQLILHHFEKVVV